MNGKMQAEDIAWIYLEKAKGPHPAGSVFWASANASAHTPQSIVFDLISGIFDRFEDQSFFILRNPILTTGSINDLERAIVKLTAKRVASAPGETFLQLKSRADLRWTQVFGRTDLKLNLLGRLPEQISLEAEALNSIFESLESQVDRGPVLHDHHREIAALLLSSDGKVLGASLHQGKINKTRHAEVCLCLDYFERTGSRQFPDGAILFVSLKPCLMCSEFILKMSQDLKNFTCVYRKEDKGPMAQGSRLEKSGRLVAWEAWAGK